MSSRPRKDPGNGPSAAHAATSRPGAGFTSLAATRYSFGGGVLDVRGSVGADLLGQRIDRGSELRYAVLPEWHDTTDPLDGFAADAVAVDLVFVSGARLSDHAPVDQYGVPVEARAQHEGRTLHPDQWNLVRVDLDAVAGEIVARVEFRVADTRTGDRSPALHGWIDVLGIHPIPTEAERPSERARIRQGSMSSPGLSRGNTAPTVAVPGGFVGGIPVTRADSARWPYSWHADNREDNRPALQAFATSHLPSPWMGDRGVFQVMPGLADGAGAAVPASREARALAFSHDDEIGRPHDYRVRLEGGIFGEMTATDHTVLLRFTYPPGAREAVLIFDQVDGHGELRLPEPDPSSSDAALSAFTDDGAAAQADRDGAPRAYLHAHLDRPVVAAGHLRGSLLRRAAPSPRGWVRVALDTSRTVTVRLATSFIGTAQAARNLVLDGADADFDTVRERAAGLWDSWIGRVELPHANAEQRAMMATALYRVGLFPSRMHENLGTAEQPQPHYASPFHPVAGSDADRSGAHIVAGELSVNHGFWDVYRTAWPLYALLDPALAARLLDGFVEHYRAGGWTSRWAAPGPIDSMTGTSNDIVLAHAVAAGVPVRVEERSGPDDHRLDLWSAFDSALRNATVVPPRSLVGRKGLATSPYRGWVDTSVPEGLSWTLDGAINDLAVARLAEALQTRVGQDDPRSDELDAAVAYFTARATAYANVFDARSGFFVGRDLQGRFRLDPDRYDPRIWGYDYTETNGWGTAFTVPHDGAGLAAVHGGRAALDRKLEQFFATPESGVAAVSGSYPGVIHEMVEARNLRAGQWAPSNQPAHHIPFMALFAGRPDIAQDAVRTAVERMFTGGEIGQGWPGDEDNGEMAAWWVFAALGLYPLVPGTAGYVLVAPSVTEARIRLGVGALLTISAPAADRAHRFIRSVRLNGEPWHRTFVPHELLASGAAIEFDLSDEPQRWGTGVEDEPPSLTAPGQTPKVLHDLTSGAAVRASSRAVGEASGVIDDDASAPGVLIDAGEWVEISLAAEATPEFLTLTLASPGQHRFRVECLVDGGWEAALSADATFRWAWQLRPFGLSGQRSRTWRVLAQSPLEIRQLELLVAR
ncbi:GH92 family glycosyl hydrolase [Microbacterium sp. CIAB417]|uniref:GH92 family glycosyl hydrolase n=1 Tax=Microbacterium sp. CIAB417 TaxID=2860287 RepID=UPI001FADA38B|nr:GH92 family glycosyl hydrolase [Microbacterium sp. CIAB417]